MKTYVFYCVAYVAMFLPIYNPGGILELQIPQSLVPGLRKGIRVCNPYKQPTKQIF